MLDGCGLVVDDWWFSVFGWRLEAPVSGWGLTVGGWQLAVGGWRLVIDGFCQLAVGGWRLAVDFCSCWLVSVGS